MKRLTLALPLAAALAIGAAAPPAHAEKIRFTTNNIENWSTHFLAHRYQKDLKAKKDSPLDQVMEDERKANDEDNWQTAQVIQAVSPDILVVQEGCGQEDLDYFAKRWLNDAYPTHISFKTNTTRDQNLDLLMKPGFKILQRRDQFYKEKDPVGNKYGDQLFARGPVFVLVESPGGHKFWVGTTHQKSKGGNSVAMAEWRNREASRTHQIMMQLRAEGPTKNVILMGDTNDELGIQGYEQQGGGDATAHLAGPPADGFVLATKPLIESGALSFGGYFSEDYRSFIDQAVVSKEMMSEVTDVWVYTAGMASVSSDHYPVVVDVDTDLGSEKATTSTRPAAVTDAATRPAVTFTKPADAVDPDRE